jgi:riboflavin synthase alpha subunit
MFSLFSLGESITVNGVKIKVVKADDSGDTVEISK